MTEIEILTQQPDRVMQALIDRRVDNMFDMSFWRQAALIISQFTEKLIL